MQNHAPTDPLKISFTLLMAVLFAYLTVSPTTAAGLMITSAAPSNVFMAGENVRLRVEGPPTGAAAIVSVRDYDGSAVSNGANISNGVIDLGHLARGYYEVTVTARADSAKVPVIVLPRPTLRKAPALAVDAAHSWLILPSQFEQGADLLRRAGRSWARERMNWPEVEPERGVFKWGKYDDSATIEHQHGIFIDQIFHNAPAWSTATHATNRFPDDLRDAYRFGEAAARHFKGRVQSWEIWNEADISGFSVDPGSEYAAFLKAAYLGFKAGDPEVLISMVSLAIPAGRYEESLLKNGTAGYYDIYNYHTYTDPQDYPARAAGHFAMLDRYHMPQTPVWITEAGIALHSVNSTLSAEDKRRQAEFIPKSCVMSLASGTDRHFYFVFPHYLENGVEFGLMDKDLMPYPGYAALAAASDLLGEARYRAEIAAGQGVHAFLFNNGPGDTLVAWSDEGTRILPLPVAPAGLSQFNCIGAAKSLPTGESLSLPVTPSPIYLLMPHGKLKLAKVGRLYRQRVGPRPAASPIIVRLRPPDSTFHKDQEIYQFRAGEPTPLQVEAYNFGTTARQGTLHLIAPAGWILEPKEISVHLDPMGRQTAVVTLTPPTNAAPDEYELHAGFVSDGGARGVVLSPLTLDVTLDPATLQPSARSAMDFNKPQRWQDNISGNGQMSHGGADDGALQFDIHFNAEGDRWAYPTLNLDPAADWRPYGALAFDYTVDTDDPGIQVQVILAEKNGSAYIATAGTGPVKEWKHTILPFTAFNPGSFAPADPNGKLALNQLTALRVGVNTHSNHVTLRVRNMELVAYGK